jgi:hypothetical protein
VVWQLIISGLVGWSLVTIKVIAAWQVVCLEESLLFLSLGTVSSISSCKDVTNESCPFWIPKWLSERMSQSKEHRDKLESWDAQLFSCFQFSLSRVL